MRNINIIFILVCIIPLCGSWTPKSDTCNKRNNCVMDIYSQNNTSVTVEFVKMESSYETKTNWNLTGNGGNGDGGSTLEWDTSEGFGLSVRMGANPGTGSIKVYMNYSQVACRSFTNNSTATTYVFVEDFSGMGCPGGFFVYIEPSSCQ